MTIGDEFKKIVVGIVLFIILLLGFSLYKQYSSNQSIQSISDKLKDTSFINYIRRDEESIRLQKDNAEILKSISALSSQKVVYIRDNQKLTNQIKQNEKIDFSNKPVTDSIIKSFTDKLNKINGY